MEQKKWARYKTKEVKNGSAGENLSKGNEHTTW